MLMIQAKMYHKPIFKKKTEPEYSPEQKRYLEFYRNKINPIWIILAFCISIITLFVCINHFTSPTLSEIYILIPFTFFAQALFIFLIYKSMRSKLSFLLILILFFTQYLVYHSLVFTGNMTYYLIGVQLFSFILLDIIVLYIPIAEYLSKKAAVKIVPYLAHKSTGEHTAVILPHDSNRLADGGDKPALELLEGLEKYGEPYQVYFCLTSDEVAAVLTNPLVKRIWMFGHGDRGGCCVTDNFFTYSSFMTEHIGSRWELRNITPKEYVYQCHCNPKNSTPLTDYLLEEKGLLDENIDDMPNYHETGVVDMKIPVSINTNDAQFMKLIFTFVSKITKRDMNYMTPGSISCVIKRYLAHLEKKQKMSE